MLENHKLLYVAAVSIREMEMSVDNIFNISEVCENCAFTQVSLQRLLIMLTLILVGFFFF